MKTRISKHYRDGRHDGWKKTVAGREWFLAWGTSASDEARAIKIAATLEAKWQLLKLSGAVELSQTDFEEIKDLVSGERPRVSQSTIQPLPPPDSARISSAPETLPAKSPAMKPATIQPKPSERAAAPIQVPPPTPPPPTPLPSTNGALPTEPLQFVPGGFWIVRSTPPPASGTLPAPPPAMMARASAAPVSAPAVSAPPASAASAAAPPAPAASTSRRWLFETMDVFMGTLQRQVKPDYSNADYLINSCERLIRAKGGVVDMPLDLLRRKELDDWLAFFGARPLGLRNNKPIGAVTIRNITQSIRVFLNQCIEWEWWVAPPLWERAFKPYSIRRLSTEIEKRERRKRPQTHTLEEKRVLWHQALPFQKALMALADWAGHTQTEISTLRFEEIQDASGEMYIDRHRHKTGVQGRWWIPPEAAAAVRSEIAKTSRDARVNPSGFALLTPSNMSLVHRSGKNRRAKSDYVLQSWNTLLRWTAPYGVRPISFKYMRKGTSQMVRDRTHMELSKVFCAQSLDDVQDMHYSRPSFDQLENCIRAIYADVKGMYAPIEPGTYDKVIEDVYRSQGATPPGGKPSRAR